jgi:hypothetical protein
MDLFGLQAVSTVLFVLLACGWLLGACRRKKEADKRLSAMMHSRWRASTSRKDLMRAGPRTQPSAPHSPSNGSSSSGALTPAELPPVTVVLPVGGSRLRSHDNWKKQLAMVYPGQVTFLFVVSSKESCAYDAVQSFLKGWRPSQGRQVSVLVAGIAHSCSQKNLKCEILDVRWYHRASCPKILELLSHQIVVGQEVVRLGAAFPK